MPPVNPGTTPVVYVPDTRPTMHYGSGVPDAELGEDLDSYLDVPGKTLYGPKTDGAWGDGVTLEGDQGEQGEPGTSPSGAAINPSGAILAYAGISLPTGYLLCDGSAVARATYPDLFAALTSTVGTATMTIASPGVVTKNSHGLEDDDGVYFTTTGALPTGLSANTTYYLVNKTTNTFQLAATRGGAAINTSGSQSGIHTLYRSPWGGVTASDFAVPDLRGRVWVGLDQMGGTDAGRLTDTSKGMGESVGTETTTLTTTELPAHTHADGTLAAASDGAHTHTQNLGIASTTASPAAGAGVIGTTNTSTTTSNGTHTHDVTGATSSTGSGAAFSNMQPSILGQWIIKT